MAQTTGGVAPATEDRLREVKRDLQVQQDERSRLESRAKELEAEMETVRTKLIASAARIQDLEETLTALEDRERALGREERTLRAALERRQSQTASVLTTVQRLAWRPTDALIIQPGEPADTVRGAILLRSAIPRIRSSATALATRLQELNTVSIALKAERSQIASTRDRLRAEHGEIAELMDRTRSLRRILRLEQQDTERRLSILGGEAADLVELMAGLEAEAERRKTQRIASLIVQKPPPPSQMPTEAPSTMQQNRMADPEPDPSAADPSATPAAVTSPSPTPETPPAPAVAQNTAAPANLGAARPALSGQAFRAAKGTLPLPARGSLISAFGDETETGDKVRGIRLKTRSNAQIVAPFHATVAFAGPFRAYGKILILEHGDGYHTLLAGLNELDGVPGQYVSPGEPIGRMGSGDDQILYLELRQKGQPIDPLPWLQASKGDLKG
ncbi:MAG: murein hydrolase activator EnvC family protein [Rhodospirillaceae bacterium]